MEIYTVIGEALDPLYRNLVEADPNCDETIWRAINRLTQRYENLNNGGPIDYGETATQYAYLYKYAGARACAVYSRLNPLRRMAEIFETGAVTVTSLGAGPGSDMLGVLKYRAVANPQAALNVNLIDAGPWIDTARFVSQTIPNHLDGGPNPTVRFRNLNLRADDIGASLAEYGDSSLFTLSYVLSELPINDAARLLDALVTVAGSGTVLLIIDNNIQPVAALLENTLNNPLLNPKRCWEEQILLLGENVENLGAHFERFGDYERGGHPNIVLNARCFAATKV